MTFTGPWANWDDTLEGQSVYFDVETYPDQRKCTQELRDLIEESGEEELTPGRAKKETIKLCTEGCEEYCETESHQKPVVVWTYRPRRKAERKVGLPRQVLRCSKCRLLCLASGKGKAYVHGAWNGFKVDKCPGSKQACLDPKTTKRAHLESVK